MIAAARTYRPAVAALALACVAPSQAPAVETFAAPDGSRFLLAPDRSTSAPPIVHWVIVVPASLDEDPIGALGLSRAVIRASLDGTWIHGSRDAGAEAQALAELDAAVAAAWEAAGSEGNRPIPESIASRLANARQRSRELGDRSAWKRAISLAPATEPELHEVAGATLLHVAAPTSSLPRTAVLLHDWRENASLRSFHRNRDAVTHDLATLALSASGRLQREVLGTTFLGAAAARYVEGRGSYVSYEDAQRQRARLVQAGRSVHVLSGGFDPAIVRDLLARVFATTRLPASPAPAPLAAADARARRSVIPSPLGEEGVALAWSLPQNATAMEIDALVDVLSGTPDAFLSRWVGRLGRVQLLVEAPYPPTARPGLVYVEAISRPNGPNAEQLEGAIAERLASAAESLDDEGLAQGAQRAFGRRVVATHDPRGVAFALAVGSGIFGRSPEDVLVPPEPPSAEQLRALAEEIFSDAPGCVVALAPSR